MAVLCNWALALSGLNQDSSFLSLTLGWTIRKVMGLGGGDFKRFKMFFGPC